MQLAAEDINNNPDFLPNVTINLDTVFVGTSSAVSKIIILKNKYIPNFYYYKQSLE